MPGAIDDYASRLRSWLGQSTVRERVLIVGSGPLARGVANQIQESPERYHLLGVLNGDGGVDAARPTHAIEAHEAIAVTDLIANLHPDRIIVESSGSTEEPEALVRYRINGIAVEWAADAHERLSGKLAVESMPANRLVVGGSRRYRMFKRIVSIVVAVLGVVITAPFMLLIALAIKLDSCGPVFFLQDRIGLHRRRFRLIKFRSMGPRDGDTSEWVRDNVDRITRVGRWLRGYHLDELPQFFNILAGEMDLIGPRPTPLSNHDLFEREVPGFALRSRVRPGMTGWAQVRIGYANDLAGEIEKTRYDLYYLKHQSVAFDLWIIVETFRILLLGHDPSELGTSGPSIR